MPSPPNRSVSPGVTRLIPPELQEILWNLHQDQPLLPSIFDLRKGQGRYTQHINQICLLPYFYKHHTIELAQPLDNLRLTVLQTEAGLLMRLSSKTLEAELSHQSNRLKQGEFNFEIESNQKN